MLVCVGVSDVGVCGSIGCWCVWKADRRVHARILDGHTGRCRGLKGLGTHQTLQEPSSSENLLL